VTRLRPAVHDPKHLPIPMPARPLTTAPHGHVLTNSGVWSPDSRWIVYDTRSAPDGGVFDGTRIERVEVESGRVEMLYESRHGAACGVATSSPSDDRVVFILGPERPTADWSYGAARRQGVVVRTSRPGAAEPLDARDLVPPFTPGALRGGSHVHVFSPDAALVSFTYEDAVLEAAAAGHAPPNPRTIGVAVCGRSVQVPAMHPRNHPGTAFSVIVVPVTSEPRPGSDDLSRACEEGWVGARGYRRADGSWQRRALAFQGTVRTRNGASIAEVFIVDLPDHPAAFLEPGAGPLAGTPTTLPSPPRGVSVRRLTFTADRPYPGIQGPRHWLRSSPDGERIALLARDDARMVQLFTVSPRGGEPVPVTRGPHGIASAFSWSPTGEHIACVIDGSVCLVEMASGAVLAITDPVRGRSGPRPEACVFSPDGRRVAYAVVQPGPGGGGQGWAQIWVADVPA
jgi:hypothetical protein